MYLRIETLWFDTSIGSSLPPINLNSFRISCIHPCLNFPGQRLLIWYATIDALSGQDTEFDLSHVEPTAMLGQEVKLEAIDYSSGFIGLKGQIESGRSMRVEIIKYHNDLLYLQLDQEDPSYTYLEAKYEVLSIAVCLLNLPCCRLNPFSIKFPV